MVCLIDNNQTISVLGEPLQVFRARNRLDRGYGDGCAELILASTYLPDYSRRIYHEVLFSRLLDKLLPMSNDKRGEAEPPDYFVKDNGLPAASWQDLQCSPSLGLFPIDGKHPLNTILLIWAQRKTLQGRNVCR